MEISARNAAMDLGMGFHELQGRSIDAGGILFARAV
jgi:hypothetical protein